MRERISSIASFRSWPHVKFMRMSLMPSSEVEVICSRPATALNCCSSGRVMSSSISSGPTPRYVTLTVIVGRAMSGSRSTGSRDSEMPPSRMTMQLIIAIMTGRWIANRGMLIRDS